MVLQTISMHIGSRLINSLISAIVIVLCSTFIYLMFRNRLKGNRQKQKVRYRIAYISILIFLLMMIRVWVEGFTHIFTMLSLIAAGLVITNKENIMNIAGWLIINWRGVFSEGDFIQIQNSIGCVESIKLLNFKIFETTGIGESRATGKTIKIPNSLIITNPVIVFPTENTLLYKKIDYMIDMDHDSYNLTNIIKQTLQDTLKMKYKNNAKFSMDAIKKNNKVLYNLIDLEPKVDIKLISDESTKLLISSSFYCYPNDFHDIESELAKTLLKRKMYRVTSESKPLEETLT